MKTAIYGAMALAGVATLIGCGQGSGSYTPIQTKKTELAKIDVGDGKLLFPLKVGNQWTYNVVSEQNVAGQKNRSTDELTFTISDIKTEGTKNTVTIDSSLNGNKPTKQTWLVDDRGIFQTKSNDKDLGFNPPQPSILFPLKEGKNFEWKGEGLTIVGVRGKQAYTGTLLKPQFVDTDMGTFTAVGLEAKGTFEAEGVKDQGRIRVLTFWAKGVGLIRYRQETAFATKNGAIVQGGQTITLKKHSLKN